jgi:hypothetical protein
MFSSRSRTKSSLAVLIGLSISMLWLSSTSQRLGSFTSPSFNDEAVNSASGDLEALGDFAQQSALTDVDTRTRARVLDAYGKLPLSFEANEGHFDSRVRFIRARVAIRCF